MFVEFLLPGKPVLVYTPRTAFENVSKAALLTEKEFG